MGKHGPCRHCGVTTTPLWRNGPPDKPVLCNACGSRWRTKGSLTNYTPLHARELIDSEEFKVTKVKSIPFKPRDKKLQNIKHGVVVIENAHEVPYSDQNFRKILEVDTSNRSSSGSATSYSESCAHVGTTEASDVIGSAQPNVWESQVPSKKRTCVNRTRPSAMEMLTKDLYTIFHEDQSSFFTSSSDLLYESETPVGSFEIGNGSVLLRYPHSKTIEEESEASSLPRDSKSCLTNEAYSGSASFPAKSESKGISSSAVGTERLKKSANKVAQVHVKREKSPFDKLHILRDRNSPLVSTDMQGVVNYEVFMKHMTDDEQKQLMKYLPSVDNVKCPESLRAIFSSSQFNEALSYFQQLLQEGMFESPISGVNFEECTTLKRHLLQNLTRSTWVEYYKNLKDARNKQSTRGKGIATGPNLLGHSNLLIRKRSRDVQNLHSTEPNRAMRSPKRVTLPLDSTTTGPKLTHDTDDFVDDDGSCFSPRSFFATPPDRSSMLCSLQFSDDSCNRDLLLDGPRNATSSFPEAELLYHPWNHKSTSLNNLSTESGVLADVEESRSNFPVSNIRGQKLRR